MHLEIAEVVLMNCKMVHKEYQQNLRIFYEFVPNKSFGQLLDISPKDFIFLNTFNLHILKYGSLIKVLKPQR